MRRTRAFLVAFALALVGCTGGSASDPSSNATPSPSFARGGTFRGAFVIDGLPETFDPQLAYSRGAMELFRCCLVRTLLSYKGRPTDQGGAEVRPDLATDMPDVSSDGLTWTFSLKPGLLYAPPLQDTKIVAGDIVRALEREARIGSPYAFYYDVIQGFSAYATSEADSISGLEAPNDRTLVVRLTTPTGDLGHRLALPGAAPLPSGVADGHDDYGPFLVASGPYMIEGSQDLDPSLPPHDQSPVSGYVPDRLKGNVFTAGRLTLVRNPSWDRSTDRLRAAYLERIELSIGGYDVQDMSRWSPTHALRYEKPVFDQVSQGRLDMVLDASPPVGLLRKIRSDPERTDLLYEDEITFVNYISLNLAVPPLDDVHVRKAMNLALDKASIQRDWFAAVAGRDLPQASGGGSLPTHLAPDALEGGLLDAYQPSWMTTPEGGDVVAAHAEMALSKYDTNGDGVCDASICKNVLVRVPMSWPRLLDPIVVRDFAKIGIEARVERFDPGKTGPGGPETRTAMAVDAWSNDYPSGSGFFPDQFYGPVLRQDLGDAAWDFPMLGATADELRGWGYDVTRVPSVDDRIQRCVEAIGAEQEVCWAVLDQYMMENVIPWVPFLVESATRFVSPRVAHYSFDQSRDMPALDQIALTPAAIAESP